MKKKNFIIKGLDMYLMKIHISLVCRKKNLDLCLMKIKINFIL